MSLCGSVSIFISLSTSFIVRQVRIIIGKLACSYLPGHRMRTCLLLHPTFRASAAPPCDNTSRVEKAMHHCKDEWSVA
jgi:hypothetical protein